MEQLIATGFHRCNMTTNEGGTIDEENLANYANDRVNATGWVWLGATLNCAACHDHKFDRSPRKTSMRWKRSSAIRLSRPKTAT